MRAVRAEPLDRGDALAGEVLHRDGARANGLPIADYGARATEASAAAELRTGETEIVAQVPEERHGGVAIEIMRTVVNGQLDHEGSFKREVLRNIVTLNGPPDCVSIFVRKQNRIRYD